MVRVQKILFNRHFIVTFLSFVIFFIFLIHGLLNGFKVVYWRSAFSTGIVIVILSELLKQVFKKTKYYDVARMVLLYLQFMALLSLFSTFGVIISYCAVWGKHLANPDMLTKIDKLFFGFDWYNIVSYTAKISFLPAFLNFLYDSITTLPFVLIAASLVKNDISNIWHFVEFIVVTAALTAIIFWLYPVVGPSANCPLRYSFIEKDYIPSLMAAANQSGIFTFGLHSVDGLLKVKDNNGYYYMTGIVTFPSYHTVFAVGLMYFTRNFARIIKYIFYFFGVGMIVSAIPIGGHYLTDIFAGLIVAWFGILAVDWQSFGLVVRDIDVEKTF
jgi:membrane-associated phospholipid phosphatase